jgi:site-specific recombinase XerD
LPATPETVSAYLASLADTGLKASTIRRRKAAIAFTHRWSGFEPPTSADVVKKTLAGINRGLGTAVAQKAPATADIVERVIDSIPTTIKADLRDRALILLGFSGAFRRSEFVGLDVEDITRAREGIIVTVGKCKTDQEGRGQRVPIPKGRLLRTVAALEAYLDAASITEGAVFRQFGKGGRTGPRLAPQAVDLIVKRRFEAAGFEAYSAHSLRAGFLTSAMEHGADIFRAADQGRWRKLETVREYDRRAKLFHDHVGSGFL